MLNKLDELRARAEAVQIDVLQNDDEALGAFVRICIQQGCYRDWTIKGIERLFVPPIELKQYGVFVCDGQQVGFFTWAGLSAESSAYISRYHEDPRPYEWRSGPKLWLVDFVCGGGYAVEAAGFVRRHVFSPVNRIRLGLELGLATSIRRSDDGTVRRIAIWRSSSIAPDTHAVT